MKWTQVYHVIQKHILAKTGTEPSSKHYFEDFIELCHPLRSLPFGWMDWPGADIFAEGSAALSLSAFLGISLP